MSPRHTSAIPIARRLARREPIAYAIAWTSWVAFFTLPIPAGLLLKAVLDRVADDSTSPVLGLLVFLTIVELGRWAIFGFAVVQWHGCWVFWNTLPRVNLLRSLVTDPGPTVGRLPSSSGEAVSRFRDDALHLSMVLDVWLDMSGAAVSGVSAIIVMAAVDARVTFVIVVPVFLALALCRALGNRLRVWRRREREATAAVTGFIGDVFGAIGAVKVAGAEPAVARRFHELGETAGGRRQGRPGGHPGAAHLVGRHRQPRHRAGGAAGRAGAGGGQRDRGRRRALRQRRRRAGQPAALGGQPRRAAPPGRGVGGADGAAPARPLARPGGGGVAPRAPARSRPVPAGPGRRRPSTASVTRGSRSWRWWGLTAIHPGGGGIVDVDLEVPRGSLTVITGPVGAGKSTLLRGLLGLVPIDAGEIRWNGAVVTDPSQLLVPPRAAYVAQVPRLFSEPLADAVLLGVEPGGLLEAVRLACLDDDVGWMPDGLATVVGAKGVRLSGGQIQRTAAARAFVRRPELLVIDDISSALDVDTEARMWAQLLDAGATTTILVVSHRAAVLERATQIIELDEGRRIA